MANWTQITAIGLAEQTGGISNYTTIFMQRCLGERLDFNLLLNDNFIRQ